MSYQTRLSKKEFKRMEEWNERAYKSRLRTEPITYQTEGLTITAFPDVHAGNSPDSRLLTGVIKRHITEPWETLLDMGTGTGVQGIFAAKHGKRVLSVDIFPKALENAHQNALANGVEGSISFCQNDGFKPLLKYPLFGFHPEFGNWQERKDWINKLFGKCDRIALNPPFRPFKPKDNFDAVSNDENYDFLTRFLKDAKKILAENGKIWLTFGTSGDVAFLENLLLSEGYSYRIVANERCEKESWIEYRVYEIIYLPQDFQHPFMYKQKKRWWQL